MKIYRGGIFWGPKNPDGEECYYFYWWNLLSKKYRYLGPQVLYYDGYHFSFGFWFFNWSWNYPIPAISKWMVKKYYD